ncbi:hypothetical protein SORBI_3001G120600 [Sorghum bicolor]|uniref:Uncharacterized protein n=1 Tax=Sorghum bicolor TaxID=4558 RepID=A0A1B6QIL5_SORBI|nr:hypothetical protein SORBI_3001G120600 [Sorghum bicolor]
MVSVCMQLIVKKKSNLDLDECLHMFLIFSHLMFSFNENLCFWYTVHTICCKRGLNPTFLLIICKVQYKTGSLSFELLIITVRFIFKCLG